MATGKRYYWIKLRDTFMRSDAIDFLMGQNGGANYVVLYQMLCLMTINTDGRLSRTIGEVVIPYDVEKIQRDCKYFSVDTIRIALTLYQKLGLIYEDRDGTLVLVNHKEMVGTETDWSEKKRRQRSGQIALPSGDNVPTNVPTNVPQSVPTDIRDKILEKDTTTTAVAAADDNPFGEHDDSRPDFNTLEAYATSNLRNMTADNMEELASFRKELPEELIRYAINAACGNGRPIYKYLRSILNSYINEGIKTIGDAKAAEAEFERRKKQQQGEKPAQDNSPGVFGEFY